MSESKIQVDAAPDSDDDFVELVVRHLEGRLTRSQRGRLNAFLAEDPDRRDAFVALCTQACLLASYVNLGAAESAFPSVPQPTNALTTVSPVVGFLGGAWNGTVAYFSQIGPLSYLVATVLFGLGMLVGSWITVGHPVAVVEQSAPPRAAGPASISEMQFVGRITGMADCRWVDPKVRTSEQDDVPLGHTYALAAGFLEITYASGARVILEGPATYEVDSVSSGVLSLGKLTALVEKKGELSGVKGERTANPTPSRSGTEPTASLAPRPSAISPFPSGRGAGDEGGSHSRLSTLDSQLFSIRTPTAVVTDLGTEFGVAVGRDGTTTSHVFRGAVDLQLAAGGGSVPRKVVVRENESARVEKGPGGGGLRLVPPGVVADAPAFTRQMAAPAKPPKVLDLLDVVAGGNGTGQRRDRGISPFTGIPCAVFPNEGAESGREYRQITWHGLIDGVFVPNGGEGAVQLDSAGHRFGGLPKTSGSTWGAIWSRSANVGREAQKRDWTCVIGPRPEFTPDGRGLLALHANAGITFNLEAMRKMYRAVRPTRFQTVGGMVDARPWNPAADGMADLWVFVDGQLKFHRDRVRPRDGAFRVDVAVGPDDRFLTLVSTDGDKEPVCDWLVLGDPILQMAESRVRETHHDQGGAFHPPSAENREGGPPMKQ
jgi:hypothetical protein